MADVEPVEVVVARMDERQKAMRDDLGEVKEALGNHMVATGKLIGLLQKDVKALQLWRAKVAGIAIAVSGVTGATAAGVFALVTRALGI